jgi:hypothetical protein
LCRAEGYPQRADDRLDAKRTARRDEARGVFSRDTFTLEMAAAVAASSS